VSQRFPCGCWLLHGHQKHRCKEHQGTRSGPLDLYLEPPPAEPVNGRLPLSFLLAQNKDEQPPVEPTVPFAAMYGEDPKIVIAVLERTVVLAEPSDRYERITAKHDQVLVDPGVIAWRMKTASYEGHRLNGSKAGEALAAHRQPSKSPWRVAPPADSAARQRSDDRARENQREIEEHKQRELAAHRQRQRQPCEEEEVMSITQSTSVPGMVVVAEVGQKACSTCGKSKPLDQFRRDKKAKDGLGGKCKDCTAEYRRQWYAKKKGAPSSKPRLKVARRKGKPRAAGVIPTNGEAVAIGGTALTDADARHDRVLALLRRQDQLRSDLARVTAELQEAIAG